MDTTFQDNYKMDRCTSFTKSEHFDPTSAPKQHIPTVKKEHAAFIPRELAAKVSEI